jgi:hypothetical protein
VHVSGIPLLGKGTEGRKGTESDNGDVTGKKTESANAEFSALSKLIIDDVYDSELSGPAGSPNHLPNNPE